MFECTQGFTRDCLVILVDVRMGRDKQKIGSDVLAEADQVFEYLLATGWEVTHRVAVESPVLLADAERGGGCQTLTAQHVGGEARRDRLLTSGEDDVVDLGSFFNEASQ
ncbi:MAG: hypothetical protein ABIK62_03410, partial [candidate division WOR-3 bacterium]